MTVGVLIHKACSAEQDVVIQRDKFLFCEKKTTVCIKFNEIDSTNCSLLQELLWFNV